MVLVTVKGVSYYMNPKLKEKWDKIKDGKLKKHDEDRVYVVDGRERTGKSLFAIQQASYIDPTILDDEKGKTLPRITFSPDETLEAIRTTRSTDTQTKVIIFDEAFRGLSSKSALSVVNKQLVQAMMEMGQCNIVLFIVSPSFFLLEMYPAVLRSNALFHIKKMPGSNRRVFNCYNYQKKALTHQIGLKRGWSYPIKTGFKDNFFNKYPGGDEFEARYRKKKWDSLKEGSKKVVETSTSRKNEAMYAAVRAMSEAGMNQKQIKDALEKQNHSVSKGWVSGVLNNKKEVKGNGYSSEYEGNELDQRVEILA